jgi:hypothetical protein
METQSITPWYLDKSLWLLVTNPLLNILSSKLGISLSPEAFIATLLPVITFIIMHKWKSGKIVIAEIEAMSARYAIAKGLTSPPPASESLKDLMK